MRQQCTSPEREVHVDAAEMGRVPTAALFCIAVDAAWLGCLACLK